MLLNSSWELLVSVRNPWMVDSSSSRMSVTAVSTTCAFAPGSTVETEMIGGSMSGSSRTERRGVAVTPENTPAAERIVAEAGRRNAGLGELLGGKISRERERAGKPVQHGGPALARLK